MSGDDDVMLKDLFAAPATAQISKSGSSDLPSTHIVVTESGGVFQEYALTIRSVGTDGRATHRSAGGADSYLLLDPELFYPDPQDGASARREVPATNVQTGATGTAIVTKQGVSVAQSPGSEILLVSAVPVIGQSTAEAIANAVTVNAQSANGSTQTFPFLGIRSLRINQSFDGWVSDKQEVQFTSDTDNYGLEFSRYNTRQFDKSLWTRLLEFPHPEPSTQSTANLILSLYDPIAGRTEGIWFWADDVNYQDVDYTAWRGRYVRCGFISNCGPASSEEYDFPIVDLSSTAQRAYMNEDDYAVGQFSTRSGDWQGNIRTYNFGTGSIQTLETKVDGNNHAIVSSDRVFTSSGVRGITLNSVLGRIPGAGGPFPGSLPVNVDGLRWDFSYTAVTLTL